jgi:hypothetical protein
MRASVILRGFFCTLDSQMSQYAVMLYALCRTYPKEEGLVEEPRYGDR